MLDKHRFAIYQIQTGILLQRIAIYLAVLNHLEAFSRIAKVSFANGTYYFHKDHLGSSSAMTNSSGVVQETTNYMPFGEQREHTGSNISNYKFTDQELDPETGLYYYGARYYDPIIGRFISPDSIVQDPFDPQTLNRYTYCSNNPVMYIDPSGNIQISINLHFWVGGHYTYDTETGKSSGGGGVGFSAGISISDDYWSIGGGGGWYVDYGYGSQGSYVTGSYGGVASATYYTNAGEFTANVAGIGYSTFTNSWSYGIGYQGFGVSYDFGTHRWGASYYYAIGTEKIKETMKNLVKIGIKSVEGAWNSLSVNNSEKASNQIASAKDIACDWIAEGDVRSFETDWKPKGTIPPLDYFKQHVHIGTAKCIFQKDTYYYQKGHYECFGIKLKSYDKEWITTETKHRRGYFIPAGPYHRSRIECE